jgi:tetratricopeptide (TPR) repeat protein
MDRLLSNPTARAPSGNDQRPTLPAIISAARAGSVQHALALFEAGGFAQRPNDAAALAVRGRLAKDTAARAAVADQPHLYARAAEIYAAADALSPQPYTKINVASLRWLAGDHDGAQLVAHDLLDTLANPARIAETPYYLAATRAEAYLLCGNVDAARAALSEAVRCDPDGWSDRASTLAQFSLLLTNMGRDAHWLDAFRPPRTLQYAGHMGVPLHPEGALTNAVDAIMTQENIGFGYGALAAGADILIAEALLKHGAELHIVLPTTLESFIAQSITPYAPAWRTRFDACLDQAHGIRSLSTVAGVYEPLATKLAADVAMGSAVMNARRFQTEAVQLLIVDEGQARYGDGLGTRYQGERWQKNGSRQHVLVAPRRPDIQASGDKAGVEGRADRRLAAMLYLDFLSLNGLDDDDFASAVDQVLLPFRAAVDGFATRPEMVLPAGNARIVVFADPDAAWSYARELLALPALPLQLRIAAHYGLAHWLESPPALVGHAISNLTSLAAVALPGIVTASETFATALSVNHAAELCAEEIGEVGTIRLFALTER